MNESSLAASLLAPPCCETGELVAMLRAHCRPGASLVFAGGEPTLHPGLLRLIELARGLGCTQVGVVSTGRRLAQLSRCRDLVSAGATSFVLAIQGHCEQLHDLCTAVAGSFVECMAGLRNLLALGQAVAVFTTILKPNFRSLAAVARQLLSLDVCEWRLTLVRPQGRAAERLARVVPRLTLLGPPLGEAISRWQASERRLSLAGVPLCHLLSPAGELAPDGRPHTCLQLAGEADARRAVDCQGALPGDRLATALAKAASCAACALAARCPGTWREYLDLLGCDELCEPAALRRPSGAVSRAANGAASGRVGRSPTSVRATIAVPGDLPPCPGDQRRLRQLGHERAAREPRQWVRLTRTCNNRCRFCHDAANQRGQLPALRSLEEIEADLRAGRQKGARRLVLSGGEPTLHPRFVECIALGRRLGYQHLQVISNGRRFAYPWFLGAAVAAGLDEITFSIHDHRPEVHDYLVGVPGAFAQSLSGLCAALACGRPRVSVDVVVSRHNVAQLRELLLSFVRLGVFEFDLLRLVPFGRAFDENWAELSFDAAAGEPALRRALSLADDPRLHLWTNRWPASDLEGFEELIQDPCKLADEVDGRRGELTALLARGQPLACLGERCRDCFLDGLCRFLERLWRRWSGSEAVDVCRVRGPSPATVTASGRPDAACPGPRIPAWRGCRTLWVVATDADEARDVVAAAAERGWGGATLWLELEHCDRLATALPDGRFGGQRVERLRLARPAELDVVPERGWALPPQLEVGLAIDGQLAAALSAQSGVAFPSLSLFRRNCPDLASALGEGDHLEPALAVAPARAELENVPPCLARGRRVRGRPALLDAGCLDAAGGLDIDRAVERFILDDYYVRSRRCQRCAAAAGCEGVHINHARAFGLARLRPLPAAGPVGGQPIDLPGRP